MTTEARGIIPPGQPIIEAAGIGRRDRRTGDWLLRDVSLAIHGGERLGIVGPSGAGKTVLLRALALLDPLDAGEVHWRGKSVHGDAAPAYRGLAIYLHQRPALFEGTVEENLRDPFTLNAHRTGLFDRGRAAQLLTSLGRDDAFLARSSRELSGGEAQLVAFVRAVQLEPLVLFLDEPTASLDPATALALEAAVDTWLAGRPADRALVWVSHDQEQTRRMTGRRISLRAGRTDPEA